MPAALDSAGLLRARRMRRSGQRAWWDGGFRVRAAATCLSVCVCLSVCHQGWRLRPTARGRPRGKLAGLAGWPEPSYQSTEAGRGWTARRPLFSPPKSYPPRPHTAPLDRVAHRERAHTTPRAVLASRGSSRRRPIDFYLPKHGVTLSASRVWARARCTWRHGLSLEPWRCIRPTSTL